MLPTSAGASDVMQRELLPAATSLYEGVGSPPRRWPSIRYAARRARIAVVVAGVVVIAMLARRPTVS